MRRPVLSREILLAWVFSLASKPAIPSSLKSAPHGAGSRQGRALRPEGASEP